MAKIPNGKRILRKKSKVRLQIPKPTKVTREELRIQRSLVRFREYLLGQMGNKFDRVLSGKLAAVDFLLSCCKKDGNK